MARSLDASSHRSPCELFVPSRQVAMISCPLHVTMCILKLRPNATSRPYLVGVRVLMALLLVVCSLLLADRTSTPTVRSSLISILPTAPTRTIPLSHRLGRRAPLTSSRPFQILNPSAGTERFIHKETKENRPQPQTLSPTTSQQTTRRSPPQTLSPHRPTNRTHPIR